MTVTSWVSVPDRDYQETIDGNLLSDGVRVDGRVIRSVLSPGVYVAPGAVVRDSVIFNDTTIGPGAVVDRAIIDKQVHVGEGATIGGGEENTPNEAMPTRCAITLPPPPSRRNPRVT